MNEKSQKNKILDETNELTDLMTMEHKNSKKMDRTNENKIKSEQCKYIETMMKEVLYNSLCQACIKIYQTKYLGLKIFLFCSTVLYLGTLIHKQK